MGPAKFKAHGRVLELTGEEKLAQAEPFHGFPSLNLEVWSVRRISAPTHLLPKKNVPLGPI